MFVGESTATSEIDTVILAEAGIQKRWAYFRTIVSCHHVDFTTDSWIPASAGMTKSALEARSCVLEKPTYKAEPHSLAAYALWFLLYLSCFAV